MKKLQVKNKKATASSPPQYGAIVRHAAHPTAHKIGGAQPKAGVCAKGHFVIGKNRVVRSDGDWVRCAQCLGRRAPVSVVQRAAERKPGGSQHRAYNAYMRKYMRMYRMRKKQQAQSDAQAAGS